MKESGKMHFNGIKQFTLVLFVFFISVFIIGCSKDGDGSAKAEDKAIVEKVYTWKMGTIYNDPETRPNFNSFGISMDKFIKLVNEKSNGQIQIEPYYSSILGKSDELFESLRRGELEVFYGQPMSTVDSRFGAFSIPYIFADYDAVEKLIANPDAPLFKLAGKWVEENHAHLVCSGVCLFRGFFNTKHQVSDVTDVRDMKVRIYEDPIVSLFWKTLCNATPMAFSEVYTALQTKAVDGLEFASTSVVSSRYYELGQYYSDINWQWTWASNIIVSQKVWNDLPENLKKIVTECAWEAMEVYKQEELKNQKLAEETLSEKGVTYHHLTVEERASWIEYARSLDAEMRDTIGPEAFDAIIEAINSK